MDGTGSGLKIFYNNKVGEDDSKTYVLKIVETSKDKFSRSVQFRAFISRNSVIRKLKYT